MEMKRLSILVSIEAFNVLKDFQEKNNIRTRDEAMDRILREFGKEQKA